MKQETQAADDALQQFFEVQEFWCPECQEWHRASVLGGAVTEEVNTMKRCYEVRSTTPQNTQGDFRVYVSDDDMANDYPWLIPAMRVLPIGAKVTISGPESSIVAEVVESHVD